MYRKDRGYFHMSNLFCVTCLNLKEPLHGGDSLKFKCNKCGKVYDATPEQTLLASEELSNVSSASKFKYTVRTTAFDPTNPKIDHPCDKCGQKITTYQRMGDTQKMIIACDCGHIMQ
jgi:DNA-directed RNA polymerase subunit M/transcription elongation factor TFIIS